MSSRKTVVDEYRADEYREKRGKGIVRLLSELQWIHNAEADNDKPYEEKRILFRKRLWFMGVGASLAVTLHFVSSFCGFFSTLAGSLVSPVLGEVLNIWGIVFKAAALSYFPCWLIKKYHLWDRGITRSVLNYVIWWGYVPTAAILIFMSLLFYLMLVGGLWFGRNNEAVKWILSHFPFLTSTLSLVEYPIILLLVIAAPYLTFRKLDRKNRWETKPYTLLDEVPEE
jgi:hypothetical protein